MNCPQIRKGGRGKESSGRNKHIKQVQTGAQSCQVLNFFYSSSVEETAVSIKIVRKTDQGSIPQCVWVQVQGVPAYGLVDSGADITITGGALLKMVAIVASNPGR